MAKEPQIQVRYLCERCDGSGRIPDDPAAVGRVVISETHECSDCNGSGEARRMWIGISWLRDQLQ
jgi:DnaJ-class molecular chaperone